ncbi:MAG: KamA family radical SAM protein [Thermoguttaceae bacterium]
MSNLDAGGPSTCTRLEVDEEPPGSPVNLFACPPSAQAPRPQWRSVFPGRDFLVHSAHVSRAPRSSPQTRAFRRAFYRDISDKHWNDWRWQVRHRICTLGQLEQMLLLSDEERQALMRAGDMLPFSITPYYMSLISRDDPQQPLRRTVVPTAQELIRSAGEADDPLGEEHDSPVAGLVHRYPDRALLLVLDSCSSYCRYCTRSRMVGHGEMVPNQERLELALDYIRRTPAIRDVLLSGGDPLLLSEQRLDWLLTQLRAIPHVEFIRLGTKTPAVLPQRITRELCRMLRKHHPLWMSLHFIHPNECTPETFQACTRLADAGIPLGSQTVLLRGVNDNVETMKDLVHRLLKMRVRPYYLYQCDPISGSSHFRTPVAKGLEIIEGLRGHTTGYAVPTYVIDAPGGGGKIPLQPNCLAGREGDDLLLRNYQGGVYRYPDP